MWKELFNLGQRRELLELITPRRSFADVILPETTRRQLYDALMQIEKHRLIFSQWGLGERHQTGTGLAFNFAGPPGTGKTICAEAVARALGKKLYKVRYSEMESCWAGETGKNVLAVFRDARQNDAVLFFDEADSIASRRFTGMNWGYEREANHTVNILLKELEDFEGVVIFATNLAANFDPAFERRIRTHILFEMPGLEEREQIWQVQVHPQKTPLAEDVDFRALAAGYPVSGGDIKNAVLKAAQRAAAEPGPDEEKRITQRHLTTAMEEVVSAKKVMAQNLFGDDSLSPALQLPALASRLEERVELVEGDLNLCREELGLLSAASTDARAGIASQADALSQLQSRLEACQETWTSDTAGLRAEIAGARAEIAGARAEAQEAARSQSAVWEERWQRATVLRIPRWATLTLFLLSLAAVSLLTAFAIQ